MTMKTKEELNALKEEVEAVNKKLAELNEEEQEQVTGGGGVPCPPPSIKRDMPHCVGRPKDYDLCPYKNDYSQCPNRNVTVACDIERYL